MIKIGQAETYNVLRDHPNKWFTPQEICEISGSARTATTHALNKLDYSGVVQVKIGINTKLYKFNPKKVWD